MAVSDYSTTAASNTAISGTDITGATGKVKDGDNAIRQMMADIKAGVPYLTGNTMLSSGSSSAGASPYSFVIQDTSDSGAWNTSNVHVALDFSSSDASGVGAGVRGRLGLRPTGAANTTSNIVLQYAPVTAGTMVDVLVVGVTNGDVKLPLGQLNFPATQNASSDANTLDDYEEGTANATFAFATPGTSSWSYADRVIRYTKIGDLVTINCDFDVTPTIGTGSGSLSITGFPFTPVAATSLSIAQMGSAWAWPASRTMVVAAINTAGTISLAGLGSGVGQTGFAASNMTTGGTHTIRIQGTIKVS